MPDSLITVAALTLTPGIGHNLAKWTVTDPHPNGIEDLRLDTVELHASATNDRSLATKVAEGRDNAAHMGVIEGVTYYYWVKARNRAGRYGDWFPSGSTSGVAGTVGFAAGAAQALINGKLSASVASNALTIAVKTLSGSDPSATNPVYVGIRDQSGSYNVRAITAALSLTVPNGATLGAINATPFRVWVQAFDMGDGTVRLGAKNCSTASAIFPLAENGLGSAVAIDTAADSAGVFYAAVTVTAKSFRVVGFLDWDSGLATAGAWATAPSVTVLFGVGSKLPGDVVQLITNPYSTWSSITSVQIPFDDSLPQSNEGTQVFSTSITPASKINHIENEANLFCGNASASIIAILALFQDAGADAIATTYSNSVSAPVNTVLFGRARPGTVAETTYKIRMGDAAGGITIYINGYTANRVFGGTLVSYHRLREIMG